MEKEPRLSLAGQDQAEIRAKRDRREGRHKDGRFYISKLPESDVLKPLQQRIAVFSHP